MENSFPMTEDIRKIRQNLKRLEDRIGYHFTDISWLETAMRHSSWANEHGLGHIGCNERIEFLGDAVLELVSSEYLYDAFPDMAEGRLTKLRASLVCEPTLAFDARVFGLQEFLLLGKGEEQTGGRERDSIISDALESVIGAIFKDGGLAPARKFILRFIMNDIENKKLFYDSKSVLQEMIQAKGNSVLEYDILDITGPQHDMQFTAEVKLDGAVIGKGKGHSKKTAEQQAAYQAILGLKRQDG